jgi:hypothetical protein
MPATPTGTTALDRMPADARLWVFGSSRALAPDEAERLLRKVDAFLAGWHAHGHPVVGARDWRHGHFLLVAADERATGVSGCSIDSLFRTLKEAERELGAPLLDSSRIWYRGADGTVRSADRAAFRAAVRAGEVSRDTPVFDNTVATVGALREGEWERAFADAWHASAFGRES